MDSAKSIDLYEYGSLKPLPKEDFDVNAFKDFLDGMWTEYKESVKNWRDELSEDDTDKDIKKRQQFLYFDDRGNFKSKNYVGYIKFQGYEFNLYPKVCKGIEKKETNDMLIEWLEYSDVYNFPRYKTSLEGNGCKNIFECLIYIFAKYTRELFSTSLFQHYEEVSEETNFLKGKLNFNEYTKNIALGRMHKFHCTYDSFKFNNKFNQIVKYVTRMLFEISKSNKCLLSEILFILDDVDDVVCTYEDCKQVYINRFMEDFVIVLNYCKWFLQNSIAFNQTGGFESFAFLLRTEVLFEDYVSNLTKEKLKDYKVELQNKCSLDKDEHFLIKPDILLYFNDEENLAKIIDVKYKDVQSYEAVASSDIYQCLTYATKLKCNDVTLIYPKTSDCEFQNNKASINVEDIEIKFRFIECCSSEIQNLLFS